MIHSVKRGPTIAGLVSLVVFIINLPLTARGADMRSAFPGAEVVYAITLLLAAMCILPNFRVERASQFFYQMCMGMGLFIVCMVSVIGSEFPVLALQRLFSVFFIVAVVFALVLSDRKSDFTFYRVAAFLSSFGFVAAVYSLWLKFFGGLVYSEYGLFNSARVFGFSFLQKIHGIEVLRFSSFFVNPNTFGLWLMLSIVNTLFLIRVSGNYRLVLILSLCVQAFSLLQSGSRAALVSTLLALFFLWAYGVRGSGLIVSRRFLFWLSLSVLLLLFPIVISYFSSFRGGGEGLSGREVAWVVLLKSIVDRPLLGEGFGLSLEAVLAPAGLEIGAHNMYLSMASEIGLIGFLFFLFFWFFGPVRMFFELNKLIEKDRRLMVVAALALFIGLSVNQLFENSLMRFTFVTFVGVYYLAFLVKARAYSA